MLKQKPKEDLTFLTGDLAHLECCEDEDLALCGITLTGRAVADGESYDPCISCDRQWDHNICPKGKICKLVPRERKN